MLKENKLECAVGIVGGGPVGLMLALFLDRQGVASVVFNTETTVRRHPKGSTHNARTMEHYRRLGLSTRIRELGLPIDHPCDVAYFTRFAGPELARLRMPSTQEQMRAVAASSATDQVPEPIHRANQMDVEPLLLTHARTRPNIAVRFGWQVTEFHEDCDGVTVAANAHDGSTSERWRVRFLVGCDGGGSLVRRKLGIRLSGAAGAEEHYFSGRMLSTYVRIPNLYPRFLASRRAWQYWAVNPEQRGSMIAVNGIDEFLIRIRATDSSSRPDDDALRATICKCIGAELPIEILGAAPWTAGLALVAENLSTTRVFLAGDAAHLFTPTGGFGMNTGIDDVANLAWKLAAVLQGWGGEKLLRSYETERLPIAHRNTKAALRLTDNIGATEIDPVIEDASTSGESARRAAGAMLAQFGDQFASLGVQLGARYDGSPIVISDRAPPPDDIIAYTPTSIPGGRAPHVWLDTGRGNGSSLLDRLGNGFTLLRLGPTPPAAESIRAAARALGVPMAVLDVSGEAARQLYDCDLAIIRPDQHVAWRGNRSPDDPERMVARIVGRDR